ncbi:MAG: hypothetical protein WDO13_05120 [Verrucomicrobiota bacterium]
MLGVVLAGQLVGAVAQTITSLYILTQHPASFRLAAGHRRRARAVLGAVLVAAWFPAREAAKLAARSRRWPSAISRSKARAAPACGARSARDCSRFRRGGEDQLTWGPAWLSFGAALFLLLGFAFFVPAASVLFTRLVRPRTLVARLAFGHFAQSLQPHLVAIASLVVALAMVVASPP